MNWFKRMKLSAADPLVNLRMLINDGLKVQLNVFKRDPRISQYFHNHNLQSLFVSTEAAFHKILELAERYRDYHGAHDRVRAAYKSFMSLINQITRHSGHDFNQDRVARNIAEDLRDVGREVARLVQMNSTPNPMAVDQQKPHSPQPPMQQNKQSPTPPKPAVQPTQQNQPAPAAMAG